MRTAALLAAVTVALSGLGAPAHAALVTWTFSGSSGGSPYTASVTYDSSTPSSSLGSFDGAIVAATFQSGSYVPAISVAPPNISFIGVGSSAMTLFAGAPNSSVSVQNPRFELILGDLPGLDQSHLPIAPPYRGFPAGASFNLFTSSSGPSFGDAFPISNISYSVPEPGHALALAAALALAVRSRRACTVRAPRSSAPGPR